MLTSPSPFSIATDRAQRLLDGIEQQIQQGQISTRAQLLAEILTSVSEFTNTLSAPSLRVPFMKLDEVLIKEFVSEPVDQIDEDVSLAGQQISLTRDITRQVFNISQAERGGLSELVAEITSLIDQLRLWISDSDSSFIWVGDTFNDTKHTDQSSTAFIDTAGGVVVLAPDSSVSLSDNIVSITIDKSLSEGGLPGNNLEISAPGKPAFTGDSKEPRPVLFRDTQPTKDDITAVLDGNPDTWFEWERVYCIFPQTTILAGTAHVYDPGGKPFNSPQDMLNWNCFVAWPGDTQVDYGSTITTKSTKKTGFLGLSKKTVQTTSKAGYPLAYFKTTDKRDLRLGLVIQLDQPRLISWLQLTPYLVQGTYPSVDQILISSDGNQWRNILDTPTVLNPKINQGVDFHTGGASASNYEGLGVWPFPKVPIQFVKVVMRQTNTYPTPMGVGHRFQYSHKVKHRTSANAIVVGNFKDSLQSSSATDFSLDESSTSISATSVYDVLKGERQVIGIRDLLLEDRTYKSTSQFISTPFQLPQAAKTVALLVSDKVPAEWPANTPDGKPWIYYEVSTDGQTWKTISPQVASLQDSLVTFDSPASTIYFRATMARPDDRPSESPIIYNYALKILP